MKLFKWALILIGGLLVLVALSVAIGWFLPVKHTASRTVRYQQTPQAVWQVITDYAAIPSWWDWSQKAERLPDREGQEAWKEINKFGDTVTMETIESDPPRKLVRKIVDEDLPFGGTWTWEIQLVDGGCTVTITEDGEIYNPFFRFMARFVFGYRGTMDAYLTALGKKFAEEVESSD